MKMTLIEDLWVTRIFADEFGFSDLRSNYSRLYSWMANQLGHVMLGLALVLFFYWIQVTVIAIADVWTTTQADRVLLFGGGLIVPVLVVVLLCRAPNMPRLSPARGLVVGALVMFLPAIVAVWLHQIDEAEKILNVTKAAILGLVAAVIALGALYLAASAMGQRPSSLWSADERARRADYDAPIRRWHGVVLTLAILAGAGAALWRIRTGGLDTPDALAGLVVAGLLFALAAVKLAQDWRFAVLGACSVGVGCFVAAYPMLGLGDSAFLIAIAGGLAILVLFGLLTVVLVPARTVEFDRWFYLLLTALLAFWFFWMFFKTLEPEWFLPIGAAIAGMAVWTVKEHGSDLPNVFEELLAARAQRDGAAASDPAPPHQGQGDAIALHETEGDTGSTEGAAAWPSLTPDTSQNGRKNVPQLDRLTAWAGQMQTVIDDSDKDRGRANGAHHGLLVAVLSTREG